MFKLRLARFLLRVEKSVLDVAGHFLDIAGRSLGMRRTLIRLRVAHHLISLGSRIRHFAQYLTQIGG